MNKVLHKKSPLYLIFHITYKCNSKCSFCFNWKHLNPENTNNELIRVVLTLNGIGETHDYLAGINGSFKKVIGTIKKLEDMNKKHSNMSIDIVTVLTKYNESHIPEIAAYIRTNMKINSHLLTFVRGDIPDKELNKITPESYIKSAKLVNKTFEHKKSKPFSTLLETVTEMNSENINYSLLYNSPALPCLAGKRLIVITPEGNVKPCEYLDKTFGNLRDTDFNMQQLLYSNYGNKIRNDISTSGCHCTWECSNQANIVFNPAVWPKIFLKSLKK